MSTANPEKDESDPVDGGNFKTFQTLLAECLASGSADEPDLSGKEFAAWLDERDPLRRLRDEFHYPKSATLPKTDPQMIQDPDEESVYLCGNSLGLMPKAAADMLSVHLDKWARMGVFGHFTEPVPWTHCELPLLDQVAKLVGARSADEVGLMNGLTVNIHLLLTAFYRPTDMRHKILLESKAFPSDHYAVESQIRLRGRRPAESMVCVEPREGEELLQTEDILRIIDEQGDSIAVVFFSSVQYYTGQLFDMATITRAAQAKGCLVGWDCAHSFANVPMRLHDWNVDFACWCTYKYGCSGAGGIAGVFVHERHHERNGDERLLGWWGHRYETRFRMDNRMDLDVGVRGYRLSCTPFSLSATMAGALQVFAKASLTELRQKSILLTGYLEYLVKNRLPPGSVSIMTPSDPFQRGCQLSLKFAFDVQLVYAELIRRGIAVDVRFPNVIRVAPVHLYNSFNDCWRFVDRLNNAIQHLG